jgi:hypothetical protein
VLLSEVVCPEPRTEAPLQMDETLDHNAYDNTVTHRIPQTAHPSFAKTLSGAAANASQNVEASTRGLEGPSMQDIGLSTSFVAPQGAQAEIFIANTTTVNLLPQSSQQAPLPSKVNQDHRDILQEIDELDEQQDSEDEVTIAEELAYTVAALVVLDQDLPPPPLRSRSTSTFHYRRFGRARP